MSTLLAEPVLVAFITSGFGLVGVLAGYIVPALLKQNKAMKIVQADSAAAREQVQNSHGTNLRDDLDKALAGIAMVLEGQRQHTMDINGVRVDLALERRERITLAERVAHLGG